MLDPCTFLLITRSTWMRPACNLATTTARLSFLALAVYLSKDWIQATNQDWILGLLLRVNTQVGLAFLAALGECIGALKN